MMTSRSRQGSSRTTGPERQRPGKCPCRGVTVSELACGRHRRVPVAVGSPAPSDASYPGSRPGTGCCVCAPEVQECSCTVRLPCRRLRRDDALSRRHPKPSTSMLANNPVPTSPSVHCSRKIDGRSLSRCRESGQVSAFRMQATVLSLGESACRYRPERRRPGHAGPSFHHPDRSGLIVSSRDPRATPLSTMASATSPWRFP